MLSVGAWFGVIGGCLIVACGFFMLRWGRTSPDQDQTEVAQGLLETFLGRTSLASRYVIGVSLLLLGYHLVSYSLPGQMLWLRVPPDRLWILGVGIVFVVAGSLTLDVLERR